MRLRRGLCYLVAAVCGTGCQVAIAFFDLTGAAEVAAFVVAILIMSLINFPLSVQLRFRRGRPNGAS